MTPGTVFLIFPFFLIVAKLGRWILRRCGKSESVSTKLSKMHVQEERPSYYSALKAKTREALIREEVRNFMRLGLAPKFDKAALLELIEAPEIENSKQLTGEESYRVLWHRDIAN